MIQQILSLVPIAASLLAIVLAVTVFYLMKRNFSEVEEEVEELEEDVQSLEIENRAFDASGEQDEEELFEKNIRELAERLFALLKTKHGVEDVTTYREMADQLEEMDADDKELKDELLDFYESAIRLEYSNEDLSEQEKQKMKKTAVDLIKRTGQTLEAPE